MPTADDLLGLVPVGEENAVSARLLWQQLSMCSAASIKVLPIWRVQLRKRSRF